MTFNAPPPHYNPYFYQPPPPFQIPVSPSPSPPLAAPSISGKSLPPKYRYLIIGIFIVLFVSICIHLYNFSSNSSRYKNSQLQQEVQHLDEKLLQTKRDNDTILREKELELSKAMEDNKDLESDISKAKQDLQSIGEKVIVATEERNKPNGENKKKSENLTKLQ
jgi:hypothetical protein